MQPDGAALDAGRLGLVTGQEGGWRGRGGSVKKGLGESVLAKDGGGQVFGDCLAVQLPEPPVAPVSGPGSSSGVLFQSVLEIQSLRGGEMSSEEFHLQISSCGRKKLPGTAGYRVWGWGDGQRPVLGEGSGRGRM